MFHARANHAAWRQGEHIALACHGQVDLVSLVDLAEAADSVRAQFPDGVPWEECCADLVVRAHEHFAAPPAPEVPTAPSGGPCRVE